MSYSIQNIVLPASSGVEESKLYYRGEHAHIDENGHLTIYPNAAVTFDTYFNLLALKKWKKYTGCKKFQLRITARGKLLVELFSKMQTVRYTYSEFITSATTSPDGGEIIVEIPETVDPSLVALRIVACEEGGVLLSGAFEIADPYFTANPVKLGICVCTFNRQKYVNNLIKTLTPLLQQHPDNLFIHIANNGNDLGFNIPEGVSVVENRNLGGAGGFTRATIGALDQGATHVAMMDDDIIISPESVFRSLRLLECLKPDYQDCFISGSMLSSDQRWLQYERNTIISESGFHHQGHSQDLRDPDIAADNALASEIQGVAGWWYCVIPAICFKERGLPLPIFVRGDDIEFSLRCNRAIISINGIHAWHEPFWGKFSDIMENYYLPRNMLLVSYASQKERPYLRKIFLFKKFWRNLQCYHYQGAAMNLLALRHILDGSYKKDAAELHLEVANSYAKMNPRKDWTKSPPPRFRRRRHYAPYVRYLSLFALMILPSIKKRGSAHNGFDRAPNDFTWRKSVVVYNDIAQESFVARHKSKVIWSLVREYLVLTNEMKRRDRSLRAELMDFRETSCRREHWETIFSIPKTSNGQSNTKVGTSKDASKLKV